MTHEIELDEATRLVRVRMLGNAKLADLLSALDATTSDGVFVSNRRLWDLRDCVLDVTPEELQELARVGKERDLPGTRAALLASEDATYGLSRLHEASRESEDIQVMVFRCEADALAWLAD